MNKNTSPLTWALTAFVGIVLLIALLGGCSAANSAYSRYQTRQDNAQTRAQRLLNERNLTTVNDIKIAQTAQLVKVAQEKAKIRLANAVGIRRAQDEIAKTLTPLYIQFEAIQAQLAMAKSSNHTLMWIPSTANAVPTVDPAGLAGK